MSEEYNSSDSDDCYGNVAQKLQSIKSKYEIDSIKSVNVLGVSVDSKTDCVTRENVSKGTPTPDTVVEVENASLNDSEEIDLDLIIAQNSKPNNQQPTSRSRRKKIANSEISSEVTTTNIINTKRSRKKANNAVQTPPVNRRNGRGRNSINSIENFLASRNTCQRGGRTSRGRSRTQYMIDSLPIFSVGNTDEYPDQLKNYELFKQKTNDVVIIDDEPVEDIEEYSVKVYWQSVEIVKFMLRKYQKFTTVYEYFADKENVDKNKLFFMYNDKIITMDDTPDSIDYNIAKFIDGGIVNKDVSQLVKKNKKVISQKGINIKFQCMTLKKPFEIIVEKEEKMHVAMVKFSEHIEVDLKSLKFYFDGDQINGKSTPKELELESGECIDVKITH